MVHGGGSFGHYWSVKYDMHTREDAYEKAGVATVKNSMVDLDHIILNALLQAGMAPYCMPPAGFMSGDRPLPARVREMGEIAQSGMIPVTYGDALWHGDGKTYILSGDRIMTHLATRIRPRLCIFALNENGLYQDIKSKKLIAELGGQRPEITGSTADVTGGMARKVEEARQISRRGINVFFVNGNKPDRIVSAVNDGKYEGTLFRG